MIESVRRGRSSVTVVAIAVAIGVSATLALYALTARAVLNDDPFVMARVAREVLRGKRLYAETWDNKAPLAILFYAIPELIASHSYLAIQIFAGVCALVQVGTALLYTRGAASAARTAAAVLLLLGPLSRFDYTWASSQDAANLFVTVILFASLRILLKPTRVAFDCFVAGIATLLAFNARQNCILFGAFPLLAVVLGPGRDAIVRAAAALLAGAVFGEAAVLGLMGTVGDVSGYFYTVFVAPGRYAGNVLGLVELIGFIRNDALVLVLVAALAALVRDVRALAFGAALIVVGVVSIVLPMRDHYYYWAQLLPVTSALVFLALRGQSTGTAWSAVAALSVFLLGNAAWTVAKCVLRPTVYDYYAVAEEIDGLAPAAATLFVVGRDGAPVAFASRREAANSYFWDNFLFGPGGPGITQKPQAEILREYEQRPPGVLAVDEDVIGAIEGQPQGGLNAAWELVRRLLASGRYEDAGRHAGLRGGGTTTSWRYYRFR